MGHWLDGIIKQTVKRSFERLQAESQLKQAQLILHDLSLLPSDAVRKPGTCCRPVSVCPSVCRSHVLYTNGYRYRQTFFSTDSPIVIVFLLLAPIPNSKKNTSEGVEHTGWERFAIFD